MRKLWGGAFSEEPSELANRFGQSIESDLTFWEQDVKGSIAHATMLGEVGVLKADESQKIVEALKEILEEGAEKLPTDVEDIHAAVELRLKEKVGDLGGKLHTARSRNDQVATDARLWLRDRLDELHTEIKSFQEALLTQARTETNTLLPGNTHQQHAQPISLSFHLLSYFWAFQRHGYRLRNLREIVNHSPLGAAALAGTPFPIDREKTANLLDFHAPIPNALDATSDRSFILDSLHLCNLVMSDLSRMANEIVLWTTPEFGYLKLPDSLTTGSSIMPQKRNPDMAELIRGRAGKTLGNLVTVSTLMKGLVMGYNRDTQDDKPPVFDSMAVTLDSLALMTEMVKAADWQRDRMRAALTRDFSTATDLADFLASRGMPFREAHEAVGKIVRACLDAKIGLEDLDEAKLQEIAPNVPAEALQVLTPEASFTWRESFGATGPKAVAQQIALANEVFETEMFLTPYHSRSR